MKKKPTLILLLIIVFSISWLGVLPGILLSYDVPINPGLERLNLLMTLGPLIGALIYLYHSGGLKAIGNFFKRLFRFRITTLGFIVAILSPIVISFLGAWIGNLIPGNQWGSDFSFENILINGLSTFLIYLIINTEELVWRGIVFDRYFEKYGFFKANMYIIPIWWVFHIPLFLHNGGHPAGYGILPFTFIVVGVSLLLSWIYIKSQRSLFYVHIHHQLLNGFGTAFPIFPIFLGGLLIPVWCFAILLCILGFSIVFFDKKLKFQQVNSALK